MDTKKNEIQKTKPVSPMAAAAELMQKSDGKFDVDKLDALLKVQMTWEANEAKKDYVQAMAAFKADPPKILKDKTVSYSGVTYTHASLTNVTSCINKTLSDHGLTASWVTSQDNGSVKVTCKITHVQGHSENTSLSAAPDSTGSKNAIQAIGSTVTYLQRYTLLALTGLATHDQDDDGAGACEKKVEIVPPTENEQAILDEIPVFLVDSVPEGKCVDESKIGPILFKAFKAYPQDPEGDPLKIATWFVKHNRLAEILIDLPEAE